MDISGMIGDLFPNENPQIPMYSFSRPSCLFWQGVYDYLTSHLGLTHEQAVERLKSKDARWLLNKFEDDVKGLGSSIASDYFGKDVG